MARLRPALFLFALVVASTAFATEHRIEAGIARVDGAALGLAPGDELVLVAGTRGPLRLQNLRGTAERPIVVRPEGALTITGGKEYAVKIVDSSHFVLTGRASATQAPSLKIDGGENSVVVTGFSTDFALEALEVERSGFAGIMVKLDPTEDPKTWRDAFTMRNVAVRDCVIRRTGGEGIYLGNSFYATGHLTAAKVRRPPHAIVGVRVERNRTFDTGCEGIQVGSATDGCVVAGNTIEKFGQRPFGPYQNNGLQLGEGTGGIARDNVIRDGPGHGIVVLGLGDNFLSGNRIERAGSNGIYAQTVSPEVRGPGYRIEGNTIVAPRLAPIAIRAPQLPEIVVRGNRFIDAVSATPVELLAGTRAKIEGNTSASTER